MCPRSVLPHRRSDRRPCHWERRDVRRHEDSSERERRERRIRRCHVLHVDEDGGASGYETAGYATIINWDSLATHYSFRGGAGYD